MSELDTLFDIQYQLDQEIVTTHGLEDRDLISRKCMALMVETAELANETRVFKYWSLKGPSAREVILEEYVDCLHFILSIGLELKVNVEDLNPPVSSSEEVSDQSFTCFESLFASIQAFTQSPTLIVYQNLFNSFLELGQTLQFHWAEIEQAYLDKNKINHERQKQGY